MIFIVLIDSVRMDIECSWFVWAHIRYGGGCKFMIDLKQNNDFPFLGDLKQKVTLADSTIQ